MSVAGDLRSPATRRLWPGLLVVAISAAGVWQFAAVLDSALPIRSWLFWSLARVWGGVLLFNAAALSFGHLLLTRVLRLHEPTRLESAVLSMCLGVFSFAAAMFAGGVLGAFVPNLAVGLPLVMVACGATPLLSDWARPRAATAPHSVLSLVAAGAGLLALLLLYLQTFTPDALNYDAGWMHVKIAEDYARHGRVIAFPGNYHGALPHFASVLHTWAYLLPGLRLAERWMLLLHVEFSLVVWTLAAIAATVQRALGRFQLRSTWAAFFLFPGIFVYDHNLGGAADHVLAFFAMCAVLAMLRVIRGFASGACVVLAVAAAGALLTKYQAFYVLGPIALIVAVAFVRAVPLAVNPVFRRALWRAPLLMAGVAGALVSPHFIKNWLYHRNPVYPLMQRVFTHSTPRVPNGALYVEQLYTDANWIPVGTALDKLLNALQLFTTFSFKPHYSFHGTLPIFGSLFTLLLPVLFLLRARRLWLLALIGSLALLLWGYTYNVDRNLQLFMPVLASTVAGVLATGWQLGWLARVGLCALVALQVVWGADAALWNSRERIHGAFNLIASSFDRRALTRFDSYRAGYLEIGAALPLKAKVLLHSTHLALGINRDTIQDWAGYQGLISYDRIRTPYELFRRYRSLGITHLLDEGERRPAPTKQEDVVYQIFVQRYGKRTRYIAGYRLITMPGKPPDPEAPYRVLCLGLPNYADGLYPIERLSTNEELRTHLQRFALPAEPVRSDNAAALLQRADAVVCGSSACAQHLPGRSEPRFERIATFPQFSIYAPKR